MSTVHRLCGQLEDERVLERGAAGRYRVGLRLWELGLLAPRAQGLRQVALPFLEDLYEVVHENVQLMVLDGTEVVVVERLSARDAVRLAGRPGGRLPDPRDERRRPPARARGRGGAGRGRRRAARALHRRRRSSTAPQLRAETRARAAAGLDRAAGAPHAGSVSVAAPVLDDARRHRRSATACRGRSRGRPRERRPRARPRASRGRPRGAIRQSRVRALGVRGVGRRSPTDQTRARTRPRGPGRRRCTSSRARTGRRGPASSWQSVASIRTPVAASGWPIEMPLPRGFRRGSSSGDAPLGRGTRAPAPRTPRSAR